jgi:hypothetical protein
MYLAVKDLKKKLNLNLTNLMLEIKEIKKEKEGGRGGEGD